jgi:hypothetical protein
LMYVVPALAGLMVPGSPLYSKRSHRPCFVRPKPDAFKDSVPNDVVNGPPSRVSRRDFSQ